MKFNVLPELQLAESVDCNFSELHDKTVFK